MLTVPSSTVKKWWRRAAERTGRVARNWI